MEAECPCRMKRGWGRVSKGRLFAPFPRSRTLAIIVPKCPFQRKMAGWTGFEPSTHGVTGSESLMAQRPSRLPAGKKGQNGLVPVLPLLLAGNLRIAGTHKAVVDIADLLFKQKALVFHRTTRFSVDINERRSFY